MTFEKAFEEKFDQLLAGLKDESDRAKVIIVAAHLDSLLEDLLRHALESWPRSFEQFNPIR